MKRLIGGACALGLAAMGSAQTLNRDINSFVLFALDELSFKGRNGGDVSRGLIKGGNVGVNRIDPTPNSGGELLNMGGGGSSHPVVMDPGTQVVADTMDLGGSDVTVWDVFANVATNSTMQSIRNSGPTSFTGPVLSSIPDLGFTPNRSLTNNAADVTINGGQDITLTPGAYRDVKVKDDGILRLGSGLYDFRNMTGGKRIEIFVEDDTVIQVDGEFTFNNNGVFGAGTNGLAKVFAGSLGVGSNDATIKFSQDTRANGHFYCPNGIMNLGNHTDLLGRFWAKKVGSDWNVTMTHSIVPEPTAGMALCLGFLMLRRRRR